MAAGTSRGESAILRKTTKYPGLLLAANDYLADPTSGHLIAFFLELKANPGTGAYRRDLLFRLLQCCDSFANFLSALEAAKLLPGCGSFNSQNSDWSGKIGSGGGDANCGQSIIEREEPLRGARKRFSDGGTASFLCKSSFGILRKVMLFQFKKRIVNRYSIEQ